MNLVFSDWHGTIVKTLFYLIIFMKETCICISQNTCNLSTDYTVVSTGFLILENACMNWTEFQIDFCLKKAVCLYGNVLYYKKKDVALSFGVCG